MLMIDCEKEVSSRGLQYLFINYWYWLNCVDIGDVLTETNTSILSLPLAYIQQNYLNQCQQLHDFPSSL